MICVPQGGTPNLSRNIRAIPTPGMYNAPWYSGGFGGGAKRDMPREVFETLSPAGQRVWCVPLADALVVLSWSSLEISFG